MRVKGLSDNYTWSAEAPAKWLWAVTLANTVVTSLLLAFIYEAIRSEVVSPLPLSILLRLAIRLLPLVGIAMSVTGFRLTKGVESRTSRRIAYVINGFALAFQLLIVAGLAMLWLFSNISIKLPVMH